MKKLFDKKKLALFLGITILGLIFSSINFTKIENSNTYFTIYDFFAPAASGIIGLPLALISLVIVKVTNFALTGAELQLFDLVRFFTPFAALIYFNKKRNLNLVFPVLAIVGFLAHPIGRQAWVYTLLWVIPIICHFFYDKFSYVRALGATFSQHAIGGLFFIYLIPTSPEFWTTLMPVVINERIIMAMGILTFFILIKETLKNLSNENTQNVDLESFYELQQK